VTDLHRDVRNSTQVPLLSPSRILNSWKEIAGYLGRGVRTIQRYEEKLGLPVHRPASRERSSVLAFSDELEHWLRSTPLRNCAFSETANTQPNSWTSLQSVVPKRAQTEWEDAKRNLEEARAAYRKAIERYTGMKRRNGGSPTSGK
jgi:hypothetical protein